MEKYFSQSADTLIPGENGYGPYYEKYREFWQGNLQVVHEISEKLEKTLIRLEEKYFDFDEIYGTIVGQLDILSSIYSHYNSLTGHEYILRLKALLEDYRKRYTHEGIDFNLMHFLHAKTIELREQQISRFPRLEHAGRPLDQQASDARSTANPDEMPFRWICFERNGSWFISSYDTMERIVFSDADIIPMEGSARYGVMSGSSSIPVTDLFFRAPRNSAPPESYLILRERDHRIALAATRVGRKIGARRDFLRERIQPRREPGFIRGRVRIFGTIHLYLDIARLG
ncbi:MAG: hypothetical protein EPN93_01080 [Spirochaetes bacterium]|nr:MAG: hypothetical protein EPN93_01080 [Spirochaetota bacterium]